MAVDNKRDLAFDILANLVEFTFNRNLPRTSLKIEAALDTFLEETGRAAGEPETNHAEIEGPLPEVPWSKNGRSVGFSQNS